MAPTPNDCAMLGSAVAITVPSSVSMKKAAGTINAISVGRDDCAWPGAASVLIDFHYSGKLADAGHGQKNSENQCLILMASCPHGVQISRAPPPSSEWGQTTPFSWDLGHNPMIP